MKYLILFVFVLVSGQLFAQIDPVYISPVKVGNMNLQTRKVFYQNTFAGGTKLLKLAERFKSKEPAYSVFNLISGTETEMKGTITNFQLNIDQYGVKRKRLSSFLIRPFNATFIIETVEGKNKVTVSNIWFSGHAGANDLPNSSIEPLVTSGNATKFLKRKKSLKSVTVIEKNLDELFSAATSAGMGF